MKKKSAKKVKHSSKRNNSYLQYIFITFAIVVLVLAGKAGYQTLSSTGVLGSSVSGDTQDQENNQTPEPKDTSGPSMPGPRETPQIRPQQDALNTEINNEIRKTNIESQNNQNHAQIQTEGNKTELNSATNGTQIELKTEDNGSLSIKAKTADGSEVQMQTNSLDKINEALKENDVEIGTASANRFEITNKETKAQTNFPLSVDVETHTLSVDTPAGQKDLTVLPDQAVQNLLNQKIIDKVTETSTSTNGAQLQLVQLRLYANNPVFQVNGTDNKKLLGFIPVSVQKTALVSAQTGQLVTTNENLINKILDLLSTQ